MRVPVGFVLLLLTAWYGVASPQQSARPAGFELRGTVVTPDTHQPVAGAEITVFTRGTGRVMVNGGWNADSSRSATSDVNGAFTIHFSGPGSYRVEAKKPGYGPDAVGRPFAEVSLSKEEPDASVTLYLAGFGTVTGRVMDLDTGRPVANLRLRAMRAQTRGMRFFPGDAVAVTTGADGQFLAPGLPPGDYAVEIHPQSAGGKRLRASFTAEDLDATDLDLAESYWPGGLGPEAALPVTLVSGAAVDIGVLRARKVPYYRVLVRVAGSNCEPGDTMTISEAVLDAGGGRLFGPPLGQAPCGKDVLVTGYSRGSFQLFLDIDGRTRETRGSASIPFVITDKNIVVTASVLPGVTLEGRVTAADGSKAPDFSKLSIALRAVDGRGSPADDIPTPGEDGAFRVAHLRPVGHSVMVRGLPSTHYIREIRYNGGKIAAGVVPLDEAAMARSLTIELDDKVASLAGSVAGPEGPISRAIVIAIQWPPPAELSPTGLYRAQTDATGNFQIPGLAPGEYRVIALAAISPEFVKLTAARLREVMADGVKAELGPGTLRSVRLKPFLFEATSLPR